MSTQAGTLERPRVSHLVWPAVAIAVVLAVAIALVATSIDRGGTDSSTQRSTTSGVANNTPTEMRAASGFAPAIAAGTLANTPAEIRGGLVEATTRPATFGRRAVTPRVGSTPMEVTSPDESPIVGGDTGAAHHPLP